MVDASLASDFAPCAPARASPRLWFDAELRPHNALSRRGFALIMAVAITISLTLSLIFFSLGAWPIFGFLGVDMVLLYLAFRTVHRRGQMHETVRLDNRQLTVDRHRPGMKPRRWVFEPTWLKVRVERPDDHDAKIILSSHGAALAIGHFLSPPEKRAFAEALKAALARRQAGIVALGSQSNETL